MERKTSLVLVLFLVSALVIVPDFKASKAQTRTIVVPDDYPTIASAIGNATDGDTICVKKGTHEGPINQTLVISKTISLIGEDPENTILNLHPLRYRFLYFNIYMWDYKNSIEIEANDAELSGFTINGNGGRLSITGNRLKITDSDIVARIVGNGNETQILDSILCGIVELTGFNQNISQNTITGGIGINGRYNVISGNNLSQSPSTNDAVIGVADSFNLIYNNTITDSVGSASCIGTSSGTTSNIIAKNIITTSGIGIRAGGVNNTFFANNVTHCGKGFEVGHAFNNTFYANYLANNGIGIRMGYDQSSVSRENGPETFQNSLYHNIFFNNTEQAIDWNWFGTNYWDNGTEGNYWSDYNGTDNDGNGIGDVPYSLVEAVSHYGSVTSGTDFYPLMEPFDISSVEVEFPAWVYSVLGQPPTIHVYSPQNKAYNTNSVSLNFTVDKETSWIGYSLDGQTNITINSNTTLTELPDGTHNLTVYATDTTGNIGTSETISFTIETASPTWVTTAIATALIAAGIVAVLLYFTKLRRKSSKEETYLDPNRGTLLKTRFFSENQRTTKTFAFNKGLFWGLRQWLNAAPRYLSVLHAQGLTQR